MTLEFFTALPSDKTHSKKEALGHFNCIKKYISYCISKNGNVTCSYALSNNCGSDEAGRLVGSNSVQGENGHIRSYLFFLKITSDIDMKNCHPT